MGAERCPSRNPCLPANLPQPGMFNTNRAYLSKDNVDENLRIDTCQPQHLSAKEPALKLHNVMGTKCHREPADNAVPCFPSTSVTALSFFASTA